jgi:MinD superfamily P-loop ATPase
MAASVMIGACQGCGACLRTCPEHAIRPAERTLVVLADRCTGCGECIEVCPADAITENEPAAGAARTGFRAGRMARWPA